MKSPSLPALTLAFLCLAPAALAVRVHGPAPTVAPAAPSAVAVPAPAAALPNLLTNADSAAWSIGSAPPKPWQIPNSDPDITTLVVERNGARWVELRDNSSDKAGSLRQQFSPIKAGRLSLRIALASDHVGQFGIYLGQGNASSEVERIVDVKLDSRGTFLLGSAGQREKTALTITPGATDHLFIEFATTNEDLNLRIGRIAADGTDTVVAETTIPQQGRSVSRLRVATDLAPRGAHFYVTDLVLTARPTP